jgi:hypothetical protein
MIRNSAHLVQHGVETENAGESIDRNKPKGVQPSTNNLPIPSRAE